MAILHSDVELIPNDATDNSSPIPTGDVDNEEVMIAGVPFQSITKHIVATAGEDSKPTALSALGDDSAKPQSPKALFKPSLFKLHLFKTIDDSEGN